MSSDYSSPDLAEPYDIIFSCAVCQTSISDLYRRPRTDHGFSSGGDHERVVTRLWLSECGHLTCSDHLEGGGIPFHPKGKVPSAPCPLCSSERGDSAPKQLFGIHGLGEGEHDRSIPAEYFKIPPSRVNKGDDTASALRFQYLSLLRYGGMMSKRYKEAKQGKKVAEAQATDLVTSLRETRQECAELRARIEGLEVTERSYKKFKQREPEIRHTLGLVADLANENNTLKNQLKQLGYNLPPARIYSYQEKLARDGDAQADDNAIGPRAENEPQQAELPEQDSSSSSRKRTRPDYLPQVIEDSTDEPLPEPRSMGPPPLPQHRKAPMPNVQMCSGGGWRQAHTSNELPREPAPFAVESRGQYSIREPLPPQHRQPLSRIDESRHQPSLVQDFVSHNEHFAQQPVSVDLNALHRDSRVGVTDIPVRGRAPSEDNFQSPSMRQPFAGAGHVRQQDSGYHSISTARATDRQPTTAQQAPHVPSRYMDSPFFQSEIQQSHQPLQAPSVGTGRQRPPIEHPMSGLDLTRMDLDDANPTSQSLNELSFVTEPYTQANKPVFTRPESRSVWSRAMGYVKPASRAAQPKQASNYMLPPRVSSRSSVVPNYRLNQLQVPGRNQNPAVTGFKGVKGGAISEQSYAREGVDMNTPRFPYQQQRGLYSAVGRRMARR